MENLLQLLGMVTFQAQALEYSLISLYGATKYNDDSEWSKEIQELMDARYKHTLGRLIRDASSRLSLDEDLTEELHEALAQRNWVAHHFFREYGGIYGNQKLIDEATERLDKMWPMFESVSDKLHQLTIERMKKAGLTEFQIEVGIKNALEKYNG